MSDPFDCAIAPDQALQSNDRRDSKRLACELVGKARPCTALEASNQWPVKVCDISANGVAVIVCRRFEQGTVLSLTLSGPDADDVAMPLARVRRVTTVGAHWLLGCTWMNEMDAADLNLLLGEARAQPSTADTPASTRVRKRLGRTSEQPAK